MPALVRYMLSRLFIGFVLGVGSAFAIIEIQPPAFGAALGPFEALLFTYSIGAAFALSYLATALGWESTRL